MKDIIKIVKSLKDSGLLLKGVFSIGILVKGVFQYVIRYTWCKFSRKYLAGKKINRAGEGVITAGYGNKIKMDF